MKQDIYSIFLASAAIVVLAGCEKENSFKFNGEEGQLNCANLYVDYINSGTRASNVDTGDFMVNFVNDETGEIVKSYKYSELPEIVSLPAGKYRADATYGEDKVAEWENPVYEGSSSFSIVKGQITDDVDPIECSLQNMKVEVDIVDETGMDIVGSDVQVVVKAGKNGELTYDSEHIDSIGFFKYDNGSNTIIAELSGTLDGTPTDGITRTYQDAGAGKAYRIRFHINRPDNVGDGDIQMGDGIKVDATIYIKDQNHIVDPGAPEDEEFVDDMRPIEQNPEDPGTDPGNDPGNDPEQKGAKPVISSTVLTIDSKYVIIDEETTPIQFDVTSEVGIKEINIVVEDHTGLGAALVDMGLINFNLVDEKEDLKASLKDLGFPTGDEVENQLSCHFDISSFIEMIIPFGPGDHKFNLTVTDLQNQVTKGTVWLVTE